MYVCVYTYTHALIQICLPSFIEEQRIWCTLHLKNIFLIFFFYFFLLQMHSRQPCVCVREKWKKKFWINYMHTWDNWEKWTLFNEWAKEWKKKQMRSDEHPLAWIELIYRIAYESDREIFHEKKDMFKARFQFRGLDQYGKCGSIHIIHIAMYTDMNKKKRQNNTATAHTFRFREQKREIK